MIITEAPKIDRRSAEEVFRSLAAELARLDVDAEGGDPLAEVLLRIFSRYCELIIQRLNLVPDKNRAAFLDVLNIARIPPTPAQVPLTFTPVKQLPNTRPAVVPQHTKVAAAPGPGENEPVVFETTHALTLTHRALTKILALDPQTDLYADKSHLATPEGGPEECAFAVREPVAHEWYIGHRPIFGMPDISELRLHYEIEGRAAPSSRRQAITWWIPTPDGEVPLTPVQDTTLQLTRSGEVVFANLTKWATYEIYGRKTHWLGCRLVEGESPSKYPLVRNVVISAAWEMEETVVDTALYNTVPLDLSKDFYPLGEWPRFGDVFYLRCDAFAVAHAQIKLQITLTNPSEAGSSAPIPPVSTAGQPTIQWEHWDGRRWVALACEDSTASLTNSGEVEFSVPASFSPVSVNGQEGLWLRARLISGRYGEDERMTPPSIQSIAVASSSTAGPEIPEDFVTNNNLAFTHVDAMPCQLFTAATIPHKALYLGFQIPDDERPLLCLHPFSLYFLVSSPRDRICLRTGGAVAHVPQLTWQYWNGTEWTEAKVQDDTASLTLSGLISIRVQEGDDMAPWHAASQGKELFWLRALWHSGVYESPPQLRRILLNTVPATQTLTLRDEILGSSNGLPHQVFRAARIPILHDMHLEVREPDIPAEADRNRLAREEGSDAVRTIADAQGNIEQVWVRWHEVDGFLSSGNTDRHFVVDRQSGDIRFGDGTKGLIPPAGANNIRLRRYQTGGGAFGNKPAGSVSQLRTSVPYVDSVTNLYPAVGGQDIEDMHDVRERGANRLRHRERAVTLEDYEDLAKLASPLVAKAKCYPNRDLITDPEGRILRPGVVSLVIVPHCQAPQPLPDLTLLRRVRDFLNARRAPDSELILLAPEYVRVSVEATVTSTTVHTGASLVAQCEEKIERFLHPLTGGAQSRGWAFGQRPYESDLYALLESIPGLEYVQSVSLRLEESRPGLLISGLFLPCSGDYRIRLGL